MTSILNALYERITQPTGVEQPDAHSSPFVKIVNGKLQLIGLDIPDSDVRVMSILGKARMGKSTFLNTIVSKIKGKSSQPFQTQDNTKHCTSGIDYYYCADQQLILMDCQGLALADSSHDPALLLFAYCISDIIIFNERMMLQNEALKLMEPICTFMTYLDFDAIQKPTLYFRISDGDLVKDVQDNLTQVIHTQYNDQYQSIRDSIINLFQTDIGIVKTEPLDKQTKIKLQEGDYNFLLSQDGLGFNDAIEELLESLPNGRSANQMKHTVPQIIEQINMNEKITIDKLDIVGQTGKLEILEWINSLHTPSEPEVDGTQASYEKNVEPLKTLKKNILTQFTRKFKAISDTIKDPHRQKLSERWNAPIQAANTKSIEKAEMRVMRFVEDAQKDRSFPPIQTLEVSMTFTSNTFIDEYLSSFRILKRACDDIYEPVKTKYLTWLETQEAALLKRIEQCRASEADDIANMTIMCNSMIDDYKESRLQDISNMTSYSIAGKEKPLIYIKPDELMHNLHNQTMSECLQRLKGILRPLTIQPILTNKVLKVSVVPNQQEVPKTNDILETVYELFCEKLDTIWNDPDLIQAITARKIELLRGYELTELMVNKITDVPMVIFSRAQWGSNSRDVFLTDDTYNRSYHEIYRKTVDKMIYKEFLPENTELMTTTNEKLSNLLRKHCGGNTPHLAYIFNHTFHKVLSRECLQGFVIPKQWV